MTDNCCGCGKPLFGEHGKRLVDKCYMIAVQAKIDGGKYYSDRGLARVFLCKDCFGLSTAKIGRILKPLIDCCKKRDKAVEMQSDPYGEFMPM